MRIMLKPNEHFYSSFRLYQPTKKCKECGQIIKSKKPNAHFYFLRYVKGSTDMIKVKTNLRKTVWTIHKNFFEPFKS